jgi:predicted Zn-ribbon and HTH transcriptional regulator
LAIDQNDKPVVIIMIFIDTNNIKLNSFLNITQYEKTSFGNISTYPAYKYFSKIKDPKDSNIVYDSNYVIDLGSYNNTKLSILFNAISNTNDQKIMDQIEKNVRSFVVLPNKALLAKLDENKNTTKDEVVKQDLMDVIRSAELQDYKLNTYTGFCKSDGYINATKDILKLTSLVCKDSSTAYAVTASISSGYWCVDSARHNGNSSSLNTGTSCVK